jgi:hypothetical protein
MRGLVVAANNVSHLDWRTVLLGIGGEQVGFSNFIGIGSITPVTFKAADIDTIRVDNTSAGPFDNVILILTGHPPQNYFTQLVMRGPNNLDSIFLDSAAATYGATGVGLVNQFWSWTRGYRTTWPESIAGQRRQIKLI